MTKDQAIEDFLKAFKKTINISFLFSRQHPSFLKAAQDFRESVCPLFSVLSPIKIGVTFNSFFLEERYFYEDSAYADVIKLLHLRRVKNIEFREGISVEELVVLFSALALPVKEIVKSGGVNEILDKNQVRCISVEELDYFQLLRGSGLECKDVWVYLLGEAADKDDEAKISMLVDNFDKMIRHFRIRDLLEDKEAQENIHKFLGHLKSKYKDKFHLCGRSLARHIFRDKDMPADMDAEKLREFFVDLEDTELADILSECLLSGEGVNPVSFVFFCKVLSLERHQKIAQLLARYITLRPVKDAGMVRANIEQALSLATALPSEQPYCIALVSVMKGFVSGEAVVFQPEAAHRAYYFILLTLLSFEDGEELSGLLIDRLVDDFGNIARDKDLEYLEAVSRALDEKRPRLPSLADKITLLNDLIYAFVEKEVCSDGDSPAADYFIRHINKSYLDKDFYLSRIFRENKPGRNLVGLFVRLFPGEIALFAQMFYARSQDLDFTGKILESLAQANNTSALEALKLLYLAPGSFIKHEVLRVMQRLTVHDSAFTLELLKSSDPELKRSAALILKNDPQAMQKAMDIMFDIPSPWGIRNNLILENILVTEGADLREAEGRLEAILKKRFFWNWGIKKEARRVLDKWRR